MVFINISGLRSDDMCACLTPQTGTKDFSVELLLVFAYLWGIALRTDVGGVDVHYRALPVRLSNARLTPAIH